MSKISVTREQYLDSIRQLTAAANDLVARYDLRQLTWQPENGERWNILECIDHISVSTNVYLDAMEIPIMGAATRAAGAVTSTAELHTAGFPSTKFTQDMEPPVARKFISPGKIRPRPTLNIEGILPQFLKTIDRVSALVNSAAQKDLNAVRFRNPLLPVIRFTVATGFLVIAAHGRRHLWQAEQVAKEPEFPKN